MDSFCDHSFEGLVRSHVQNGSPCRLELAFKQPLEQTWDMDVYCSMALVGFDVDLGRLWYGLIRAVAWP